MHPGCNICTEGCDDNGVTDIDDVWAYWRGTRAVMRFGNFIFVHLGWMCITPNFTFPAVAAERPFIIGVCVCIRPGGEGKRYCGGERKC